MTDKNQPIDTTTIFRQIMDMHEVSTKEAAEILGIKPGSLRNKFSKNSISLKDLLLIAYATGTDLKFNADMRIGTMVTVPIVSMYPESHSELARELRLKEVIKAIKSMEITTFFDKDDAKA